MDAVEQEEQLENIQDSKNFQKEDFVIFELGAHRPSQLQHDQ